MSINSVCYGSVTAVTALLQLVLRLKVLIISSVTAVTAKVVKIYFYIKVQHHLYILYYFSHYIVLGVTAVTALIIRVLSCNIRCNGGVTVTAQPFIRLKMVVIPSPHQL